MEGAIGDGAMRGSRGGGVGVTQCTSIEETLVWPVAG